MLPKSVVSRWVCLLAVALGCGLAFGFSGAQADIVITPANAIQSFTVQGSGTVTVTVTEMGQDGICRENMYAFPVDDTSGAIGDLHPGDAGWPAAAQTRSQLVHASGDNAGSTYTLNLQAGDVLGFSFQQPCIFGAPYVYSFVQANPQANRWNGVFLDAYPVTSGAWELGWEDGADADYNDIVVDVSNVQGNTLGAAAPPPTDTTPPTVAFTAPSDGAEVSQTIPVIATASDNIAVAGVQFQLDGQNIGGEVMSSPYSVPWDTTTVDDGNHTLTAVAYDTAGNQSAPASLQVLVANSVLDGSGNDITVGPIAADIQSKSDGCGGTAAVSDGATVDTATADAATTACATSSWCASKNEVVSMIQTMDSEPLEYHNRFTHLTYWRARASVLVCENTKKGVITDFKESSAAVTPLYALHVGPIPVWHYDNHPHWTFGATGSRATTTTAQVTDSFTGCPFGLPIGCNQVTFTVHFEIYGNGTYRYSLSYEGA